MRRLNRHLAKLLAEMIRSNCIRNLAMAVFTIAAVQTFLCGTGYAAQAEDDIESDIGQAMEEAYQITVDGKTYELPAGASQFVSDGWEAGEKNKENKIGSWEASEIQVNKGNSSLFLFLINETDEEQVWSKCTVVEARASTMNTDSGEVGGIQTGWSRKQVDAYAQVHDIRMKEVPMGSMTFLEFQIGKEGYAEYRISISEELDMVMMIAASDYSDIPGHFEDARPFYSYGDEEIETEEDVEG